MATIDRVEKLFGEASLLPLAGGLRIDDQLKPAVLFAAGLMPSTAELKLRSYTTELKLKKLS